MKIEYVVVSVLTLIIGLVVNGIGLFVLFRYRRVCRMNLNERISLCMIAVCGAGCAICGTMPTILSTNMDHHLYPINTPAKIYSPWCEAFGILNVLFMSTSSCLLAMLSIIRYVIVTYPFRCDVRSTNQWLMVGQVTMLIYVMGFYVIIIVLVNLDFGLRHNDSMNFTDVTIDTESFVTKMSESFRIRDIIGEVDTYGSKYFVQNSTNTSTHVSGNHPVSFISADARSALLCAPNWTELPSYFIAAMVAFYVVPLSVVVTFYFLITRTAYKQVRDIRRTLIRPSVTSGRSSSSSSLVQCNTESQTGGGVFTISNLLSGYMRPFKTWHNIHKSRVTRRKATRTFLAVILLFSATWIPYYVYYIIECYVTTQESRFTSPASYFITGLALGGRIFSIAAYAILNRQLRTSVRRLFREVKRCAIKCFKYLERRPTSKVSPSPRAPGELPTYDVHTPTSGRNIPRELPSAWT